jgi:hypothetical protein
VSENVKRAVCHGKNIVSARIYDTGHFAICTEIFNNENRGALPFYRFSKMLERLDVDLSLAAMYSRAIEFYNNTAEFREIFMNILKR